MIDPAEVASRVADIRNDIARLASHPVSLVAVTKTFPVQAWQVAQSAGCDAVGENYAQELLEKVRQRPVGLPIHFVGAVQSNKVKSLASHVDLWHSVDRASVVDEIGRRAAGAAVLLQVNTTGEDSKSGVSPAQLDALRTRAVDAGLQVRGLMTLGPTQGTEADIRASFTQLRSLADQHDLVECSMGMSGDYRIALECGSTIIRIGSMLFGPRSSVGP